MLLPACPGVGAEDREKAVESFLGARRGDRDETPVSCVGETKILERGAVGCV